MAGGCEKPDSHRMISPASAWADIESMRSIDAATGTIRPCILIVSGAVAEQASPCPGRLVADKQHRVLRIGQRGREMMEDASASGHAARRNHDRGLARCGDGFGLFHVFHDRHPGGAELVELALIRVELRIELAEPLPIELQRRGCHRAVDVDRQRRNLLAFLETFEPVDHFFDAADGKRGNDQLAAALDAGVHDRRQARAVVVGFVKPIAVGRFDEQHVRAVHGRRIRENRAAIPAKVAAEQQRLVADAETCVGGSEQMAGVDEFDVNPRHNRHGPVVTDRLQVGQRPRRVEPGVERQRRLVFAVAVFVDVARLFLLNVRRIRQHDRAEIVRARCAEDPAPEPLRDEPRQIAAMIKMRMCQHDGVDAGGGDREGRPIPQTQFLESLEQTAIHEHAAVAEIEQVLGAGHRAGRAKKRECRHRLTILARGAEMTRETQRRTCHRGSETQRLRISRKRSVSVTLCLCGLFLSVSLSFSASLLAQQKPLTLDDIYGQGTRVNFSGAPAPAFAWMDGTHYAWLRPTGQGRGTGVWMKVDAATGSTDPLFDAAKAEAALAALPGVSAADARQMVHSRDLIFNGSYSALLLTIEDDLYLYTPGDNRAARLTSTSGEEEEATFSPDGSKIAFVRGNNLFVVDAATRRETALTADGTATILNGRLDWVYEEEIYGRGQKRAYWWSPDSSRLAFLRIDDTSVSTYVTLDDISYDPKVETWRYPRAGDPNPTAKLGVVRAGGGAPGAIDWIDMSKYAGADFLVVRVVWTPAGKLAYEVQNRTQSWLDLNTVDVSPATGAPKTLLRETSPFWINSEDTTTPTWLQDGSFLWLSARSGFTHAYHYSAEGALLSQITKGRWELRTLHGVEQNGGWIYFSGTERSPIGGDVYRVKLDGTGLERLSKAAGTHNAVFSPSFAYFIDSWSNVSTPVQVRLHRDNGQDVRVLHDNPVAAFGQYKLSAPEFVQVKTRDGFVMEAMMIKPPDFDPSRRYPVYQFTYGGPHAQQVRNAWTQEYMYHQLLAQHGIVVWICDNRTASGKGLESTWPVFKHFGEVELRDIEDGLGWLKQQPYVDESRIGIHGWSYGGFMTAYALTHSTSFAMGIAGGTVADWRNYDTVYTERYMGTPQENPDGYRKSSPRFAAADLRGALLLVHGAIDDNVHPQNTMQLAYELQKAGKPFSLMLYPKSRHGVTDPALARHLRGTMLDFTLEHLKPNETKGSR